MTKKKESKGDKGIAIIQGKMKNETLEKFEFMKQLYIVQAMGYQNACRAFVKKFGDTERNAREYITRVKKALQDTQTDVLGLHMNTALIRLNDLYNKAYEAEKWSDCKDIQREINKLTGLDVKRIETFNTTNETKMDVNLLLKQLPPEVVANMVAAMKANGKLPPATPTIDITPDAE